MKAAMAQRNPQGRVRRDWASMTAAVAQDGFITIIIIIIIIIVDGLITARHP